MSSFILMLLVAVGPKPHFAELEFCDNPLAPAWKQTTVYPGQVFSVRYRLHHPTALGKEMTLGFAILNAAGERIVHSTIPVASLPVTKNVLSSYITVQLPHSLPAGEYRMVLHAAGESHKLEQQKTLTAKPIQLCFSMCSATYDVEGKVPASLHRLTVFQTVQIHFTVAGVGVEKNYTNIRAQCEIIDETGKVLETIKLPENPSPALPMPGEKTAVQGGRFHISINLPGKYRVKLRVEDLNTWDVATKEIAFHFHEPE